MSTLSRAVIITALSATAFSATAAVHAHTSGKHFSLGIQGSVATLSTTHAFELGYTDEGDRYVNQFNEVGSQNVGLLGAHIGYDFNGKPGDWSLNLAVNKGFGKVRSIANSDASGDQGYEPCHDTRLDQQYNLTLNWNHQMTKDVDLVIGVGASAARSATSTSILSTKRTDGVSDQTADGLINKIKKYHFGGVVSAGLSYHLNTDSSFDVSLSYYLYDSTHLKDVTTSEIYLDGYGDDDAVSSRKVGLGLTALSFGYTHQF